MRTTAFAAFFLAALLLLSAGALAADPATKQAAPAQPTASFVAMIVPSRSDAAKASAKQDGRRSLEVIREVLAKARLPMPDERLGARPVTQAGPARRRRRLRTM